MSAHLVAMFKGNVCVGCSTGFLEYIWEFKIYIIPESVGSWDITHGT